MSKTANKKKVITLHPYDFPCEPDTGEFFSGIKSMELVQFGRDLCKYLEKHILEGNFVLKDVAELFFDYYNTGSWKEFCIEHYNPETNVYAFSDWLAECDTGDEAVFVTETEKEVVFCPIGEDYEGKLCDLEAIVNGMCSLFSTRALNESKTKTVCIGKVEVNDIHTVSAEKANVAPLSAPMFTKL